MKINQPLVSFIMSTYCENQLFLNKSIKSVFNQSYKNIELILVDDGNSKLNIEDKYKKKIKLITNNKNEGLALSLNKAIKLTNGDFIARIDSDDINLSKRINIQINTLLKHPDIDIVGSSVLLIDSNDNPIGLRMGPTFHDTFRYNIWKEVSIPHPTWLVRKKWYLKNGCYKNLKRGQDQYLLLKNFLFSNYYCITQPLVAYRKKRVSPYLKFRGRISIILGLLNGKLYKYLALALIYHQLAFVWDLFDFYLKNKGEKNIHKVLSDKKKDEYQEMINQSII